MQTDSPMFNSTEDGPYNVSVTEGESVTFNCQPFSVLEVAIIWLQNYEPIIDSEFLCCYVLLSSPALLETKRHPSFVPNLLEGNPPDRVCVCV